MTPNSSHTNLPTLPSCLAKLSCPRPSIPILTSATSLLDLLSLLLRHAQWVATMNHRRLDKAEQDQVNNLLSARVRGPRRHANRVKDRRVANSDDVSPSTVQSTNESPPQRSTTPIDSVPEPLRQQPASPVHAAIEPPLPNDLKSISSAESPVREPSEPPPTNHSVILASSAEQATTAISTTIASPALRARTPESVLRRPTFSPITPTRFDPAIDAAAEYVDEQPASEKNVATDTTPVRRPNRLIAAATVSEEDVTNQDVNKPGATDSALPSLGLGGLRSDEDTDANVTRVPFDLGGISTPYTIAVANIPAYVSVASDPTNSGDFYDTLGVKECLLSDIATFDKMQLVVKAKFGRELSRLHYPAEVQISCYTLQTVGFGRLIVEGDVFNTAFNPTQYNTLMPGLRALHKPIYLQVCVFDDRNQVFKDHDRAMSLFRTRTYSVGDVLQLRAPSPGSDSDDEADSEEDVKISLRRYRELLRAERDVPRLDWSVKYEKRERKRAWERLQEVEEEVERRRRWLDDEDDVRPATEECETGKPAKKKAKQGKGKGKAMKKPVREQVYVEDSDSEELPVEPDDPDDGDYQG